MVKRELQILLHYRIYRHILKCIAISSCSCTLLGYCPSDEEEWFHLLFLKSRQWYGTKSQDIQALKSGGLTDPDCPERMHCLNCGAPLVGHCVNPAPSVAEVDPDMNLHMDHSAPGITDPEGESRILNRTRCRTLDRDKDSVFGPDTCHNNLSHKDEDSVASLDDSNSTSSMSFSINSDCDCDVSGASPSLQPTVISYKPADVHATEQLPAQSNHANSRVLDDLVDNSSHDALSNCHGKSSMGKDKCDLALLLESEGSMEKDICALMESEQDIHVDKEQSATSGSHPDNVTLFGSNPEYVSTSEVNPEYATTSGSNPETGSTSVATIKLCLDHHTRRPHPECVAASPGGSPEITPRTVSLSWEYLAGRLVQALGSQEALKLLQTCVDLPQGALSWKFLQKCVLARVVEQQQRSVGAAGKRIEANHI